jgi:hypothetical protein
MRPERRRPGSTQSRAAAGDRAVAHGQHGTAGLGAQRASDQATRRLQPVTAARKPQGPLQILISINRQTLRLFDKDGLVEQSTVSSGTGGFPTPKGIFSIIDRGITSPTSTTAPRCPICSA